MLPSLPLRRPTVPPQPIQVRGGVELVERRQKCLCKHQTQLRLETRFDALVSNIADSFLVSELGHGCSPLGRHRDEYSRSGRKLRPHVAGKPNRTACAPVTRSTLNLATFCRAALLLRSRQNTDFRVEIISCKHGMVIHSMQTRVFSRPLGRKLGIEASQALQLMAFGDWG